MTAPQITRTVAEVRYHVEVDDAVSLSWLEQSDTEMGEGFEAQAKERIAAYERGDWCMVGVYVTLHDDQGYMIVRSGGLWGIESDSGDDYLRGVAEEEVAELERQHGISLTDVPVNDPWIVSP